MKLTNLQKKAIEEEVRDCVDLLVMGIELWAEPANMARTGPASLCFCTGIEKLMKLVLYLDSSIRQGTPLTEAFFRRQVGHDIERLIGLVSDRGLWYRPEVFDLPDIKRMVTILAKCSGTARYERMDFILDASKPADTREAYMWALDLDWTLESPDALMSGDIIRQRLDDIRKRRRMVHALFEWSAQVAKSFEQFGLSTRVSMYLAVFTGCPDDYIASHLKFLHDVLPPDP